MLMYRVLMFTMLLESMTRILPKVLLFLSYLLFVTFLISHLCDDADLTVQYVILHPLQTLQYLYRYVKWWGTNKDLIGFSETFWFFFAFTAPVLSFLAVRSIFYATSTFIKLWIKSLIARFFNKKQPVVKGERKQHSKDDLLQMKKRMMQAAEQRIDQHLQNIKQNKNKDKQ